MKKILIVMVLGLLLCTSSTHAYENVYGSGVYGTGLANLYVGKSTYKSGWRFKAEYSGTIDQVRFFFIHGVGYSSGADCDLRVDFYADDGTGNHDPTGGSLGYKEWNHINQAIDAYTFELVTLSSTVSVIAGTLYHVCVSNVDGDPANNWVSMDFIAQDGVIPDPQQAFYTDVDMYGRYGTSGTCGSNYSKRIPIYSLYYSSPADASQGHTHIDAMPSRQRNIYGSGYKVRTTIVVSGGNKIVPSAYVGVRKIGNPAGPLLIRLEDSSNTEIETITVAAGSVGTSIDWEGDNFNLTRTLTNGQTYYLVLHSPDSVNSSNCYNTYPIREGGYKGFEGWDFTDGKWQYAIGGGWNDHSIYDDMMFYFETRERRAITIIAE